MSFHLIIVSVANTILCLCLFCTATYVFVRACSPGLVHLWWFICGCSGSLERNLIPATAEVALPRECIVSEPVEVSASGVAFPHPEKVWNWIALFLAVICTQQGRLHGSLALCASR